MITEPIQFTGRLTYEDLIEIHRLRWRVESWQRRGLRGAFLLACVVAILFYVNDHHDQHLPVPLIILFVGCLPWIRGLYRQLSERWRLSREKSKPQTEATAIITDDSVALSDETSGVRLAWKRLAAVVATPRGVLFLIPPRQVWFYLPQWILEGNSYRDEILSAAEAQGVRVFRAK